MSGFPDGWGGDRNGHNAALIGRTVARVGISEDYLTLEMADGGLVGFAVEGDCCSTSYFHDIVGVDKLRSGPIVSFAEINNVVDRIAPGFEGDEDAWLYLTTTPEFHGGGEPYYPEDTKAYGFELVALHPLFGEMTCVVSYRNDSNGYYGGWCERLDSPRPIAELTEVTGDTWSAS